MNLHEFSQDLRNAWKHKVRSPTADAVAIAALSWGARSRSCQSVPVTDLNLLDFFTVLPRTNSVSSGFPFVLESVSESRRTVLELSLLWGLRQWMDPTLVVLAIRKKLGSFLL